QHRRDRRGEHRHRYPGGERDLQQGLAGLVLDEHPAHVPLADQLTHLGDQVVPGDLELLVPGGPVAAGRAALRTAAGAAAAGTARARAARTAAAGTTRCGLAHRFLLAAPQVPFLGAPLAPQDLSIAELLPASEGSPRSWHPT